MSGVAMTILLEQMPIAHLSAGVSIPRQAGRAHVFPPGTQKVTSWFNCSLCIVVGIHDASACSSDQQPHSML